MAYRHAKAVKELLKQKENESTWLQIFKIFEDMLVDFKTSAIVDAEFHELHGLLYRSIQSDRSRLNGVALELLKRCAALSTDPVFSQYLPALLKLTGRANKIFITRAQDALLQLGKTTDVKTLVKTIADGVESVNKNMRFAAYKLVELRAADLARQFAEYVDRGLKDPALEVRTLCRGMSGAVLPPKEPVESRVAPKIQHKMQTPRKAPKVDSRQEEQIRQLEQDVCKIATEPVRAPVRPSFLFYEKLNQIKREKEQCVKPAADDELTPKRLDKYLNRYRSATGAAPEPRADIGKMIDAYKKNVRERPAVHHAPNISAEGVGAADTVPKPDCVTEPVAAVDLEEPVAVIDLEEPVDAMDLEEPVDAMDLEAPAVEPLDAEHTEAVLVEAANAPAVSVEEQVFNDAVEQESEHSTVLSSFCPPAAIENEAAPLEDTDAVSSALDVPVEVPDTASNFAQHSFACETSMFKTEMVSTHSQDLSMVHEILSEGAINREIYSEDPATYEASPEGDAGESFMLLETGNVADSTDFYNLSQCIANISIEPTRIEDFGYRREALGGAQTREAYDANTGQNSMALLDGNLCDPVPAADALGDMPRYETAAGCVEIPSHPFIPDAALLQDECCNAAVLPYSVEACAPALDGEPRREISHCLAASSPGPLSACVVLEEHAKYGSFCMPSHGSACHEGAAVGGAVAMSEPSAAVQQADFPCQPNSRITEVELSFIHSHPSSQHFLATVDHRQDSLPSAAVVTEHQSAEARDEVHQSAEPPMIGRDDGLDVPQTDVYGEDSRMATVCCDSFLGGVGTQQPLNEIIDYFENKDAGSKTVVLEVLEPGKEGAVATSQLDCAGAPPVPSIAFPLKDLAPVNSPHKIFNEQTFSEEQIAASSTPSKKKRPVFNISKQIQSGTKLETAQASVFVGVDDILEDCSHPKNLSIIDDTVISIDEPQLD
ncbi:hypothetical protein PAPHI01_0201 [Pancytospora philotis]|nr:hypothetical protein PAPHI01_0201 [Pancytospora philotis]